MRPATAPQSFPVAEPPVVDHAASLKAVRVLIWVYLVLLLVEGALRKWALPQLSDPLLLIRDPVVVAIYFFALRARVFPNNFYIFAIAVLGILSILLTILVLYEYVPIHTILLVAGYGFRCDFLHLPLIFVIGNAMDLEDVKKIGRWTLLIMIPMAVLMVIQFKASPDAVINKTVGLGEGLQLTTAGGKIRPPATFSFISGPVFYLSAAATFVIYGVLNMGVYRAWLLLASSAAVLTAVLVSGSRACVLAVGLVALGILIIVVVRPSAVNKIGAALLALAIIGFLFFLFGSHVPFLKEGMNVLSERFTSSAEVAETTVVGGLFERVLDEFTEPFTYFSKIPLSGFGLGLGTAGGARFLVGEGALLLTENEWTRIIAENGPFLGLAFIAVRIALTWKLFSVSLRALREGEVLPILLFTTVFLAVVNGQLGQPTTLGFTAVLAGLCFAAANVDEPTNEMEIEDVPVEKPLPRRSVFANRIHGRSLDTDHTNGFVDR